jgi:hypothetical protein
VKRGGYVLSNPRVVEQQERLAYVTSFEILDGFRSSSAGLCSIPSLIPLFIYNYYAFMWMNYAYRITVSSFMLFYQWELSRKFWTRLREKRQCNLCNLRDDAPWTARAVRVAVSEEAGSVVGTGASACTCIADLIAFRAFAIGLCRASRRSEQGFRVRKLRLGAW